MSVLSMRLMEMNAGAGSDRTGGWWWGLGLALALTLALEPAFGGFTAERALARRVLPARLADTVRETVLEQVETADRAADAAWLKLGSKTAYDAFRLRMKRDFVAALGGFDLPRTPLNAKVTGTFARPGYRVEKVLFESRPGVFVTALLFLPDAATFKPPYPGCIVPCGHTEDGKASWFYQRYGILGARQGYAVFIYDPIGQGERDQIAGSRNVACHERYGTLATLLGHGTARQRIWDGMRALDYLASRPDVRRGGYGCMGQSGGGTETALMAALDDRLVVACPSCFVSTVRDVFRACGPQDAEQQTFGQLAFGLNHAGLVLMGGNAVRMHCNNADFFPFAGSCATLDVVTNVAARCGLGADRYGMTELDGPHACTEGTKVSTFLWMRRWLTGDATAPAIDGAACRALDRTFDRKACDCGLSPAEVRVTPDGTVARLPGARSVFDLLRDELKAVRGARPRRTQAELAKLAAARAGIRPPEETGCRRYETGYASLDDGTRVEYELYGFADKIAVPAVTFIPAGGVTNGTVLVLDDTGRGRHAERARVAVRSGKAITFADVACTGETRTTRAGIYRSRSDDMVSVMLLALGRSLVGVRAEETLAIAASIRRRTGFAPLLVAHGDTAVAAAHAVAVRGDLFAGVDLRRPPSSWTKAVETSERIGFVNVVRGALRDYDWTDLTSVGKAGGETR